MKKYFVISDIHSFCSEMKEALKKSGFRKTNKDHILIVCGDVFDRGPDSIGVYEYLMSIPKSRRILIRGNHESLYLDLLDKRYPDRHDFHNHTVDTFCHIANLDVDEIQDAGSLYGEGGYAKWQEILEAVKKHKITKWLKSNEWKNYYELDNKFIFVHSFIPLGVKEDTPTESFWNSMGYYEQVFNPDWRYASNYDWEEARWGCPWKQYAKGLFAQEEENGRTLVCGHWHTSDFFSKLKFDHSYNDCIGPVYFSKGIIGIDGGVMYNYYTSEFIHPQNVLIIENGECFSYNRESKKVEKLVEVKNKKLGE